VQLVVLDFILDPSIKNLKYIAAAGILAKM
jgi:hypothetical protein